MVSPVKFILASSIVVIIMLGVGYLVIPKADDQPQTNSTNARQDNKDELFIQRLSVGEVSQYVLTTKLPLLTTSTTVQAEKVGQFSGVTPLALWSYDTPITDERWLLLLPRTTSSSITARLFDLYQEQTEQSIQLGFTQTGNLRESNYGDIVASGYYDPLTQAVIYLVRRNVMLATEGAGLPIAGSTAEIWKQSVTNATPQLLYTVKAGKQVFADGEKYDLPERLTTFSGQTYLVWRGSIDRLTNGLTKATTFFTSAIENDTTSNDLNMTLGSDGQIAIVELRYAKEKLITTAYHGSADKKTFEALMSTPSGAFIVPNSLSDSRVLFLANANEIYDVAIPTSKRAPVIRKWENKLIPITSLGNNKFVVTSPDASNSFGEWHTNLSLYNLDDFSIRSIPIQGQYVPL